MNWSEHSIVEEVHTRGWTRFSFRGKARAEDFNRRLGVLFEEYPLGSVSRVLRPYSQSEAPRGSMSSLTGFAAQPIHTDGAHKPTPPRYILLRCLNPGESSCPTVIWVLKWDTLERDWPANLARGGWLIRSSDQTRFYGQVLERVARGMARIRFDPFCMRPPLIAGTIAAATNCIERYAEVNTVELDRGDCLLLDNWRVLHGRGEGAARAPSRQMERWRSGG